MVLTKTVQDEDYKLIEGEVQQLKSCHKILTERGVKIDIGHEHRFWEYGMALKALDSLFHVFDQPTIIDVGAGLSLLGPTLSEMGFKDVTEVEPNNSYSYDRNLCYAILLDRQKSRINWNGVALNTFRQWNNTSHFYDVVFCISVIEHVAADHEFLKSLADMVKQGGLLFMTTDVMPIMPPTPPKAGYIFDNLREHNYTTVDIVNKISYLQDQGFDLFGEADLTYKGDKVFDYTFGSICMIRK